MYWSLPGYHHNYLKFYQFPNSNLFTHWLLFSQENPLVKPTTPGSSFSYICFAIYFSFAFLFRSIKPKNTKIPCCNLFLFILFNVRSINLLQFPHVCLPILRRRTPKGIDNPFNTWVVRICYLCAGAVYVVFCGSPTGSITLVSSLREILLSLCCIIPSSLEKYRRSSSRHHETLEHLSSWDT